MPIKKVAFFKGEGSKNFDDYQVDFFDISNFFPNLTYLEKFQVAFRRAFSQSINYPHQSVLYAEEVHRLYIKRVPWYCDIVDYFKSKYSSYDAIIMSTYCPIHPEVLSSMKKPIKVLGFIDEPDSTYKRGVPYLWAFDGAFYISPSYNSEYSMPQMIGSFWSNKKSYFWPLPSPNTGFVPNESFFNSRDLDLCYVGNYYGPKVDKLLHLKKYFKKRFLVHGRWPLSGYIGYLRPVFGKPIFPYVVSPLTSIDREKLYLRTKIGFNMHLSMTPRETGNLRMYEVPSHGMMMLCDKAGLDLHNEIYQDGVEAVFYDSIDDAIQKVEYYLKNDEQRIQIARAGYNKFKSNYNYDHNYKKLLDWVFSLRG